MTMNENTGKMAMNLADLANYTLLVRGGSRKGGDI
jgi:hypothetical protein